MSTSQQTPLRSMPPERPVSPRVVAAVAAVLVAAATTGVLVATAGNGPVRDPAGGAVGLGGTPSASAAAGAPIVAAPPADSSVATRTTGRPVVSSYQPLWPFADEAEATGWQRAYREGGHQPWHLDAEATALGFAGHLGYAGIDRVVRTTVDGRNAWVTVGFRAPDGSPHAAADVHLIKLGAGSDAPWEVAGTRDTTLTLTRPRYGATVSSPLTVGGKITGVDERIAVTLHTAKGETPVGTAATPAGGRRAPWSVRVSFRAARGTVLTVAAAAGGHLAAVERFAVTGVRVGPPGGPRPAVTDDVDGDGRTDQVDIPAPGTLRVRYAAGTTDTVAFDADSGDGRLLGVVDADGDGRSEVFVHVGSGAYTDQTSVFRHVDGRLRVVTLDGSQVRLLSGASLRHGTSWACRPPAMPIVQWSGQSEDGVVYRGTLVSYRFSGATLVRLSSRPLTVDQDSPAPTGCAEIRT